MSDNIKLLKYLELMYTYFTDDYRFTTAVSIFFKKNFQ